MLLPASKGEFGRNIFDPQQAKSRQMTREDIDTLDEDALMFYRPYPEHANSFWTLANGLRRLSGKSWTTAACKRLNLSDGNG